MKQTLLITLFSILFSSLIFASSDKFSDQLAVIGSPSLSSDPCAVIDKKLIRLETFITMVNNTSAFHLEEKAEALAVPGITVSKNKKKMLRDAKKKYAEYSEERQKYACETPMTISTDIEDALSTTEVTPDPSPVVDTKPVKEDEVTRKENQSFSDQLAVIGSPSLSSDPCAVIDKKLMRLDRFITMVNNTSAFHLEEKAEALAVPGITVSKNKKKMLRDAKKKYAEYSSERQKYGCGNSTAISTDRETLVAKPAMTPDPSPMVDKKPVKEDEVATNVNTSNTVQIQEKVSVMPVEEKKVNNKKEPVQTVEVKKTDAMKVEHPKEVTESSSAVNTAEKVEKKANVSKPVASVTSSDTCDEIDQKLLELYEFMTMVNNTSAFHLEEKAEALAVPGITVSNNKKKMLRDAKKKFAEYSAERQKYGCETSE